MKHCKIIPANFSAVVDGKRTGLFFLSNHSGIELAVTDFGARIVELWTPDRHGNYEDIVLGHDHIDKYVHYTGERFLGATIGRYGNRIAGGRFSIGGEEYRLPLNDGPNSLHGGSKGFDMVVWDARQTDGQTIEFSYLSKDGEEGYPGNLSVWMRYRLTDDDELEITYRAETDRTTVVNLTHHSFFNLRGAGNGTINDHLLMLAADYYTPVDATLIPTGTQEHVAGTPMDFRTPTAIGLRVDSDCEQLRFGHGYDHNWVLNKRNGDAPALAATVYDPDSGRSLEVYTTEPAIQFYGGNFFDGSIIGKGGKRYGYRGSLALETQHYPDSPNHPDFPSTELNPGEVYKQICIYKFGVK